LTKTDHLRAVPAAQETAGIFTKLPGRAKRWPSQSGLRFFSLSQRFSQREIGL